MELVISVDHDYNFCFEHCPFSLVLETQLFINWILLLSGIIKGGKLVTPLRPTQTHDDGYYPQ
jgi:hypothetical protein